MVYSSLYRIVDIASFVILILDVEEIKVLIKQRSSFRNIL